MGGSPSTTVAPASTTPTIYKSFDPQTSFQATADYLKRLQEQTNEAQANLYAQSGTPGQIGARQAATNLQAASTYASTVPSADRFLQQVTGVSDPFGPARQAANQNLSQAQSDYADALKKAGIAPQPIYNQEQMKTPSWAQIPDTTYTNPSTSSSK